MWKNGRVTKPIWQALRKSIKSQMLVKVFGFIIYR